MATRKKPKKLTKASVKKMMDAVKPEFRGFVANDPKDKPQADGVNRFVSEAGFIKEGPPHNDGIEISKSPWMKLQEALDRVKQASEEIFQEPLTANESLVAIRCRRLLGSARTDLVAAAEYLEWVNQSRDARLDEIRRAHNAAVGGQCLEPADLVTSTWFHTDSFTLAADKED